MKTYDSQVFQQVFLKKKREEMEVVLMDYQTMNLEIVPKHNVPNGKVIKLNLAKNHIQKIEHLDAKILTLDLRANRIQKMEGFSHLSNLVMLLLSQNRITKIEVLLFMNCMVFIYNFIVQNFESLSTLQILDLSSNTITETPTNFGQLTNLRVLNLTNNQLTEIPMLLYNRNLKELYLKKNAISSVQQIQKRLPESIELLHLQNNKLEKCLDVKKLLIFRKLKDIRLDSNPMLSAFFDHGFVFYCYIFKTSFYFVVESIIVHLCFTSSLRFPIWMDFQFQKKKNIWRND